MAHTNTNKVVSSLYRSSGLKSWRSVRAEMFQRALVAPNNLDHRDILFARRAIIYGLLLALMLLAVGLIGLEYVVAPHYSYIAWVALFGFVALTATLLRLKRHRQILVPPVFTLLFTIALVLWSVAVGNHSQSLWLFPLTIGLAGLLPSSAAWVLGCATLLALAAIRWPMLSLATAGELIALVATWILSLSLMRLLTQHADELADLALSDPLTGAYNRRYLQPQAARNIADYQRYSRLSALLMIDIDHFKVINDSLGHAEGDRVLKDVVTLIDNRIRGVDMVFRLGGEEFVVLLTEAGAQTATKIAEELRVAIAKMSTLSGRQVTVSIGVCDVTSVDNPEHWLELVDQAMYRAKQQGRNRVSAILPAGPVDANISSSLPIWR